VGGVGRRGGWGGDGDGERERVGGRGSENSKSGLELEYKSRKCFDNFDF